MNSKKQKKHLAVIPVETGIQPFKMIAGFWIPAYAGMTLFDSLFTFHGFYDSRFTIHDSRSL